MFPSEWGTPDGHHDRLARSGHAFLGGQREAGLARQDGEALLLVRVEGR